MGPLWLSLTLLAVVDGPAPSAVPGLPHTLTLNLVDPEGAVPFGLEAVQAEAERLFAPLGVSVASSQPGRGSIQVILLAADRSRGGLPAEAMGAVNRDPQAAPIVWILVPNVRRTLGGTAREWPSLPAPLLARALGRVLAHELVHLIAPDLPHARSGLMRASVGRALLLGDRVLLDPALGPTVRQRLAAGRLRAPLV